MRLLPPTLIAVAILGNSLAAQTPLIPPAITQYTAASSSAFQPLAFAPLGPTALGLTGGSGSGGGGTSTASAMEQIEMRRIGSSGTLYRIAMAAGGVPVGFGGVGGNDVMEGTFDVATNVATLSALAIGFNTPSDESTFSISEDGLFAVSSGRTGTGPSTVTTQQWSVRATTGSVWPAPQPITGITTTLAVDLKIFTQGTQLKLAWVDLAGSGKRAGNVLVGDFNNGVVSNAVTVIPRNILPRYGIHSPHPVTEEIPLGSGSWVLHGWYIGHDWNAKDSDTYWLPGPDATVAAIEPPVPQPLWPEGAKQHHGTTFGAAGSSVTLWSGNRDPMSLPMVAMNGATFSSAAGGVAHLRVMTPLDADAWITAIFIGLPANPPIPLGFTVGNPLGQTGPTVPAGMLGVTPVIALQAPVAPYSGGTTFSLGITAGSVPVGFPIPMQALGINFTTGGLYLGNTATLEAL